MVIRTDTITETGKLIAMPVRMGLTNVLAIAGIRSQTPSGCATVRQTVSSFTSYAWRPRVATHPRLQGGIPVPSEIFIQWGQVPRRTLLVIRKRNR